MSESIERAIRYLAQSPLLHGVSEDVLRILDPPPEMIFLKSGETLIRQADENTDYFVLVSGRLGVFKEQGGKLVPIGIVLPGEGVGEMALLTNEPRSATVMARLDSELVRFPQSTFLVLAAGQPLAVLDIARSVIGRATRRSTAGRKSDYPSIAVLPLTPNVDTRSVARLLANELERYGRSCSIDDGFTGGLDELEATFDFVVYAVDHTANNWAKTCLLRADLVLFAAAVTEPVEPGEIENEVLRKIDRHILGRIDVVFIHPPEWRVKSAVGRWLERILPREHHHIRSENALDLARLARLIVGRANNLVFSGGGARAFSQVGVVRALKEFSVPVDRIGGCSMGAAIGAMIALGEGLDDKVKRFRELFFTKRPEKDFTIPLLSLMSGKRMTNMGVDLFGDLKIEEMPIRYFCISSDLSEGEILEHFDGLVWQALRSTAAMPVIAPPLLRNGRMLVDGGVLNNLPIDIMRRHFSGSVIAIDVSRQEPLVVDSRWEMKCPSGLDILRDKFRLLGPKLGLPSIFEVLRRTVTLASERQAQLARLNADLLITPPVSTFGLTEFTAFDRIVELGYRHTVRLLEELDKNPDGKTKIALK